MLKQLVAWVGLEDFLAGLREYFKRPRLRNSEFTDLLGALEKVVGPRAVDSWAQEWLQTSGVNTLHAEFDARRRRRLRVVRGRADRGAGLPDAAPAPHRHRPLRRGRRPPGPPLDHVEVDIDGASTEIADLVGQQQPDLLLLNDGDLTYAKIRLDERSLATVVGGLSRLDDSLARALCWGAAWDMTRDAEMSATDFVDLVLANIGTETDAFGVSRIPVYAAQAVNSFSAPANRPALKATLGAGACASCSRPRSRAATTSCPSSGRYAAAAHSDRALDELEGLLDGSQSLEGLDVDADLRWTLLTGLARAGRADARGSTPSWPATTPSPARSTPPPRAARPTAEAKAEAWRRRWCATTCPTRRTAAWPRLPGAPARRRC